MHQHRFHPFPQAPHTGEKEKKKTRIVPAADSLHNPSTQHRDIIVVSPVRPDPAPGSTGFWTLDFGEIDFDETNLPGNRNRRVITSASSRWRKVTLQEMDVGATSRLFPLLLLLLLLLLAAWRRRRLLLLLLCRSRAPRSPSSSLGLPPGAPGCIAGHRQRATQQRT